MTELMDRSAQLGERSLILPSRTQGLKPFAHQVAGQSLMFRYDDTTVCKSLIPREHLFYQLAATDLRQFMPQFRGVNPLILPDLERLHDYPMGCPCSPQAQDHLPFPRPDWSQAGSDSALPFSQSQLRGLRKAARRAGADNAGSVYYFLLLEDVISRFQCPCVLDLKMGTRQHGDDATPEKVAYQVNKCKSTTSVPLGIRLCGMKRFITSSGEYENKDKIYGNQLSEEELKTQIVNFLFNGDKFRLELVDAILCRLETLKETIELLDGYRFYSSSLLIVYEGSTENSVNTHKSPDTEIQRLEDLSSKRGRGIEEDLSSKRGQGIEANGIDRTYNNRGEDPVSLNCEHSQGNCENRDVVAMCSPRTQTHYDSADLHTLSSFVDRESTKLNPAVTLSSHPGGSNNSSSEDKQFSQGQQGTEEATKGAEFQTGVSTCHKAQFSGSVDIRIVDFAHATFPGFNGDTVLHRGPDCGFLRGINTLLEIFQDLKNSE